MPLALVLGPMASGCDAAPALPSDPPASDAGVILPVTEIDGPEPGALFGHALAATGSVLVVGAPGLSRAEDSAGGVLAISLPLDEDVDAGALPWALGDALAGEAGASVAAPGDCDGDGVDDFVVGSLENLGTDVAYFDHLLDEDRSIAEAVVIWEDVAPYGGSKVSPASDLSEDGAADFLIGAPSSMGMRGAVIVVASLPEASLQYSFYGGDDEEGNGVAVMGGGDLDGDGFDDLVVAWSGSATSTGGIHIVRGPIAESSPDLSDADFTGADLPGAYAGVDLAVLPHPSGIARVVAAVPSRGAFLLPGDTTGAASIDAAATATWESSVFGDALSIGDFDGDGLADAALSGEVTTESAAKGVVVVMFDATRDGAIDLDTTETLLYGDAGFGTSLAACDVDGSENVELAVGSPFEEGGGIVSFYSFVDP